MATIQGVFVALFGRPADPAGLAFFNEATNNGADLTAIGDLAATDEFQDRFDGMSNAQIINSIYLSLFNRPAEAAGLAFFANALTTGELSINNIAIAILDGAQGTDLAIVNTKIEAADLFTAAIDTDEEIALYQGMPAAQVGIDFLAGVSTTVPTQAAVDAAVASLRDAQFPGNEVELTVGADTITPTNGEPGDANTTPNNDTINAPLDGAAVTWEDGDEINGGAGTDTFNAVVDGTVTTLTEDSLVSVEIVNLASVGAQALDFADVSGVQQLWHDGADAAGSTLTITNIAEGTAVGARGDMSATTTSFAFDNADEATVALEDVEDLAQLNVIGADAVTVAVDGDSAVAAFATDAEEIVINGEGDLGAFDITAANAELIDVSGLDGSIVLTLTDTAAVVEVVTAASVGDITIVTAGDEVTLVISADEESTQALFETVFGFTANDVLDLSAFGLDSDTFIVYDNLLDGASYGAGSVGLFETGGDTWVFIDSDGNGSLNLATDTAFLLDTVGAASLTADNFIF